VANISSILIKTNEEEEEEKQKKDKLNRHLGE